MFEKKYENVQDLANISSMVPIEGSEFVKSYPNYDSMTPAAQYLSLIHISFTLNRYSYGCTPCAPCALSVTAVPAGTGDVTFAVKLLTMLPFA